MSTAKYHNTDNFSGRLKALKKAGKFTQKQIALAADVKQPTVSAWENGEYLPGGQELYKLADFFGITTDELLGRSSSHIHIQTQGEAIGEVAKVAANEKEVELWRRRAKTAEQALADLKAKLRELL